MTNNAIVAKLADAQASEACVRNGREGSTPSDGTMLALIEFLGPEQGNMRKQLVPSPSDRRPYMAPAYIDGQENTWSLAVWIPNEIKFELGAKYLLRVKPLVADAPFQSGSKFELREGCSKTLRGVIVP